MSGDGSTTTLKWLTSLWLSKLRQPLLLLFRCTVFADHRIYESIVNVARNRYRKVHFIAGSSMAIITEVNEDSTPPRSALVSMPMSCDEREQDTTKREETGYALLIQKSPL